ncbi:MAG: ATP-binding cassette domain-containing protein [Kiritimatiellae bacterium]|jgi:NitT/TauT family transport system ATP-binding protein|nr:ATP-binding cassette domain-containing protein [Kiritimatiellia bacterium]
MIDANNLTLTFSQGKSELKVLSELSFHAAIGEIVSVIGPSGCGKTSLLNIFAGLLTPSCGTVKINGSFAAKARKEQLSSYVFQKPVMFEWRTLLKNVLLPSELKSSYLRDISWESRADELLNLMGMSEFKHYYPHQVSGGMQARASLARAYLTDPKVLLMDEPFASLDQITRDKMSLALLDMNKRNQATVVFVTHSIEEAVFISDRVYLMSPLPSTFELILEINFQKERKLELRDTSEFIEYTRILRKKLEGNGYD